MKKWLWRTLWAMLNTLLMLVASFWLIGQHYLYGEEEKLTEWGNKIKNIFLGWETKPPQKDFIFINVAYDKQLIDKIENEFVIGKQPITDRYKLAKFLNILSKKPNNQRFIILDVFFADSVPADSNQSESPDILLQRSIQKLPNLLISNHLQDNGKPEKPIFKAQYGLADYITTNDKFFKYQLLFNDSLKTIPLLAYEYLHKTTLQKGSFFNILNEQWILTTFVLDFKIRNYDLFQAKERYKMDNLTNILSGVMTEQDILDYVKDRIVVIGDFETKEDTHLSIYGEMPGALILLNAYLALQNGDNIVYPSFLLFLFTSYFLLTLLVFYPPQQIEEWIERKVRRSYQKILIETLSFAFLLALIWLASFVLFGMCLSIFLFTLWLSLLRNIFKWWNKPKKSLENPAI